MTPIFYAFREREMIQDLMESATGARMHHSYCRVGGLKDDLPEGFLKEAAHVLEETRKRIREYETLVMGNEIIAARTKGGPAARRDGDRLRDVRTRPPRERRPDGSAEGRAVREVRRGGVRGPRRYPGRLLRPSVGAGRADEAVLQHHRAVHGPAPAGAFRAPKLPKTLKMEGEVYVRTENPLGLMGYYLVGDGKKQPYRLKMRPRRSPTSA